VLNISAGCRMQPARQWVLDDLTVPVIPAQQPRLQPQRLRLVADSSPPASRAAKVIAGVAGITAPLHLTGLSNKRIRSRLRAIYP
jgi:hypothetical protein